MAQQARSQFPCHDGSVCRHAVSHRDRVRRQEPDTNGINVNAACVSDEQTDGLDDALQRHVRIGVETDLNDLSFRDPADVDLVHGYVHKERRIVENRDDRPASHDSVTDLHCDCGYSAIDGRLKIHRRKVRPRLVDSNPGQIQSELQAADLIRVRALLQTGQSARCLLVTLIG